jgi:hypothetical protein
MSTLFFYLVTKLYGCLVAESELGFYKVLALKSAQ